MADITIKDIFEAMPGRFNSEAAGSWTTCVQFHFDDENWILNVADGTCTVEEGTADNATATINTNADTWIGMITGKVNPMQAFMSGQIKIAGNMADVMKLQDTRLFSKTSDDKNSDDTHA
jgi:putative sterol carrier protein